MNDTEALKNFTTYIKNIKNFGILKDSDLNDIIKNIKNKKIVKNKSDNII